MHNSLPCLWVAHVPLLSTSCFFISYWACPLLSNVKIKASEEDVFYLVYWIFFFFFYEIVYLILSKNTYINYMIMWFISIILTATNSSKTYSFVKSLMSARCLTTTRTITISWKIAIAPINQIWHWSYKNKNSQIENSFFKLKTFIC